MLEFNKQSRLRPSNLIQVQLEWDTHFQSKYGRAGMFIDGAAYKIMADPVPPNLAGLTAGTLEYDVKLQRYKDEMSLVTKSRVKDLEKRVQIYSDMWSLCSEPARAEVAMDPDFTAIHQARDDPLALWR